MAREIKGKFVVAAIIDGSVLRVYGNTKGDPFDTFEAAKRGERKLRQSLAFNVTPDTYVQEIQEV